MNKFTTLLDHGTLYVYEVYEYYDIPIIFSCINDLGHKYLTMLLSNVNGLDQWMCMEISENRLIELKAQNLSLRDVFTKAERKKVMILFGVGFSDESMDMVYQASDSIADDLLPTEVYQFIVPDDEMYLAEQNSILIEANQKQREVMYWRLIGDGVKHGEMAINKVSKFLDLCQGTINTIALSIQDSLQDAKNSKAGKIPCSITDRVQLNLSSCYAGSFGVKLTLQVNNGMLKDTSLLYKSFNKLKEIIAVSSSAEVASVVEGLKHRPVKKMIELFDFLSTSGIDVDLGYAFPNDSIENMMLKKETSQVLVQGMKALPEHNQNLIEFKGVLRAMDLDKKTFTLHDESINRYYHGKVNEGIIGSDTIQKAEMNKKYTVLIIEKVEQVENEPIKISYVLSEISYETQ